MARSISTFKPPSQRIWFTADTHLGHFNIIKYCNRPFSSPEEMEEVMLQKFNRVLRKGDLLYHLGDLAWSSYPLERFFSKLNTNQLHLVLGNHDAKKEGEYRKHFQSVQQMKKVAVSTVPITLCHYAMRSWQGKDRGGFHLYGHSHGTLPGLDRSMDVGVDTHNFSPWSFEEIYAVLGAKPYFTPKEEVVQTESL